MPLIIGSLEDRPTYSAKAQADLDDVEHSFTVVREALENEHRIIGAEVKKGDMKLEQLRAFELQIFDPGLKVAGETRHWDKKDIISKVEER